MKRRDVLTLIAGAAVAWPFTALTQEPGRMYRIGFLFPVRLEPPDAVAAFFGELKRAGFVEGKNLTIEFRAFAPHPERIPEYAAELVKEHPDVILGAGPTIPPLQEATKVIPILALDLDLVGSGLVNSMARPTGNVTGLVFMSNDLDGKRQEILIELVPGIRKMAALSDARMHRDNRLDMLKEAARASNVELSVYRITSGDEISAAIDSAKTWGAEALNVLSSGMFFGFRQITIERTLALRLPAMFEELNSAEEGGFAAYGASWVHMSTILARQAIRLLRGTKVADVPVEQPFKFDLVINLKTANAMGVKVPPEMLTRADKLIE
jgi:putative ABC transport system substrate-binding protein